MYMKREPVACSRELGARRQELGGRSLELGAGVGMGWMGMGAKEKAARLSGLFLFYLPIFRIAGAGGKRCQLCWVSATRKWCRINGDYFGFFAGVLTVFGGGRTFGGRLKIAEGRTSGQIGRLDYSVPVTTPDPDHHNLLFAGVGGPSPWYFRADAPAAGFRWEEQVGGKIHLVSSAGVVAMRMGHKGRPPSGDQTHPW